MYGLLRLAAGKIALLIQTLNGRRWDHPKYRRYAPLGSYLQYLNHRTWIAFSVILAKARGKCIRPVGTMPNGASLPGECIFNQSMRDRPKYGKEPLGSSLQYLAPFREGFKDPFLPMVDFLFSKSDVYIPKLFNHHAQGKENDPSSGLRLSVRDIRDNLLHPQPHSLFRRD